MAGLATLSCMVIEGQPSPEELLEDQLIENCIRVDLKPIEQARAFDRLMKARGLSQRDLAERLNVSPASVARAVRLLDLPEEIQESVNEGRLPAASGYQIAQVEDAQAQARAGPTGRRRGPDHQRGRRGRQGRPGPPTGRRHPPPARRGRPGRRHRRGGEVEEGQRDHGPPGRSAGSSRVLQERERQGEVDAA